MLQYACKARQGKRKALVMRSVKYTARYYESCGKLDERRNDRIFAAVTGTVGFGILLALTVMFPPM